MATQKAKAKTTKTAAVTATEGRGRRNERIGVVVSDKAHKTISIEIVRLVKHERYGKYMKSHRKFTAHDENNEAKIGDKVLIVETRPLSKTKRWKLVKILEKATQETLDATQATRGATK